MEVIYQGNFINLSRQELLEALKVRVKEQRFQHILGVEAAGLELAQLYHYDHLEKVSIAALLHDFCKDFPHSEMQNLALAYDQDLDLSVTNSAIWHGFAAAQYAKENFKLRDEEIIKAVSQHTIGSPHMTLLAQIIFVADYIEVGRDFKGAKKARKIAQTSLEKALIYKMKSTIRQLAKDEEYIYLKSVENYNHWVNKQKEIV